MAEGLSVQGLSVHYRSHGAALRALDGVSLSVSPGEVLGLVGESGSGKSTVLLALLGLLGGNAQVSARALRFRDEDLMQHAAALRGRRIGMVFQDTAAALNPALNVGRQLAEPMRLHLGMSERAAWARGTELLAETGIPRPSDTMRAYPHQLSGGMKQRVGIAAGLATEPELLLLDEPTTALDVTVEAQILSLLHEIRARRGLSMLLVSHNLGIVDRLCDRVSVLYAGRVAESGMVSDVLGQPRHPYTRGLLAALPRPDRPKALLVPIPGGLPDLTRPDPGCNFRSRCRFAAAGCELPQHLDGGTHSVACWQAEAVAGEAFTADVGESATVVTRRPAQPLLEASELTARFRAGAFARMLGRGNEIVAVDRVSLRIMPGEVVGLVGESGCGKSTLGRLILRLLPSESGSLRFGGKQVPASPGREFRRRAQVVFQNPDTALNPRHTVGHSLARALRWFGEGKSAMRQGEVARLLELVRLPPRYAGRYPHQLSGGEKQRVGIARALASRPDFLLLDEAVSALDVSVQAAVLNLLRDLKNELGVAFLFISHDIGVITHVADRVVVMFAGRVMEEGPAAAVLHPPYHPYTELLLASVPLVGATRRAPPRPAVRPAPEPEGCRFAARCPRHLGEVCDTVPPPLRRAGEGHAIHCHVPLAALAAVPHWLEPKEDPVA